MRADDEFEPLQTERLVLRSSRPEDHETISAYRSDPDVSRYQGWERIDPEGIRAQIEEMAGRAPVSREDGCNSRSRSAAAGASSATSD